MSPYDVRDVSKSYKYSQYQNGPKIRPKKALLMNFMNIGTILIENIPFLNKMGVFEDI